MLNLYCIFDRVACEAGGIVPTRTDGLAVRMFKASMEKNPYPNDFVLYRVGTFDPETMALSPCTPVVVPISAVAEPEVTVKAGGLF